MPPTDEPLGADATLALAAMGGHTGNRGTASRPARRRELSDEDIEDLAALKVFAEKTSGVEWSVEAIAVLHGAFKGVAQRQ